MTMLFNKPATGVLFKFDTSRNYNEVVITSPGSGMSVLAGQMAVKQMLASDTTAIANAGQSSKGFLSDIKKTKAKPYYRQFDKRKF